jgi:Got1/Sft2-like family
MLPFSIFCLLPLVYAPCTDLHDTEIGVGLVSFGAFFLFLGIILFFDAALLALGNVLFTGGITLLIGPQKTFYFFARKQKLRGTVCFFTGMLLVFFKWTFIGMLVEAVGFLNLFG